MVLLRYPGTKAALVEQIPRDRYECWCEPFLGAGGMALAMAKRGLEFFDGGVERFVLGDADRALVALWNCVLHDDKGLVRRIRDFQPSLSEWDRQREVLSDAAVSPAALGFAKLAVHQMSYSGLGVKAGGPIGGNGQMGKWDIACRWNPRALEDKFAAIRGLLRGRIGEVWWADWETTLDAVGDATLYIDPPYYDVGETLYLERVNHGALAAYLEHDERGWWVSYDDCPEVVQLYEFGSVDFVELGYTIAEKRKQQELLISRQRLVA